MAATDFILQIEQRIKGSAASELEKTQAAFDAAAGGMKRFESQISSAENKLAALAPKLADSEAKLKAAMAAGDEKGFWKAAAAAQRLRDKNEELQASLATAKAGFESSAAAATVAGDSLADMAAAQRAAAEGARMASAEAAALAEQQANLERHTRAAEKAAAAQAAALEKSAAKAASEEAKALADQQRNLERHTQAAERAASEQARTMQQQQAKAIAEVDQRIQRLNSNMKVAAVAIAAVAFVAAKAAWEFAKWLAPMVFAKKAEELKALGDKARKNLGDIFGGLNLDPLMAALTRLVDFFSVTETGGRAVKAIFETMFQPMVNGAAGAIPKIERFLLGFLIGVVKTQLAVKQLGEALGFDMGTFEHWPDIGNVGAAVAYAVVAAFAAMGVAVAAAAYPYYAVIDAIAQLKTGWDSGKKGLEEFVTQIGIIWGRLDFGAIATNLIDGFVRGIKEGISKAVAAVSELADSTIKAAKDKLKVFSPSRVFDEIGGFVAEGFAGGVDDGTPMAQAAMSDLVEPPDAPALRSAGGGTVVTFAAGSIVIQAADGADAGDLFVARVTELLEGLGMQVGAPA